MSKKKVKPKTSTTETIVKTVDKIVVYF